MDEAIVETGKIAFYPGCSLESSASSFAESFRESLSAMGISFRELANWNCCGASSAHSVSHTLHLCLNLRNLDLAQSQGFEQIVAPCSACYHRLVTANRELCEDAALLDKMNGMASTRYRGAVAVRNVLDILVNEIGVEKIASFVVNPLSGLKVACYYGCLNTRVPGIAAFDVVEYPKSMDAVAGALGASALDWSYKTDCCGGSLFVSKEEVAQRLVSRILSDAVARGADCIAVACPMCQSNLDLKQKEIRRSRGISKPLPVLYITQLMGLAFGLDGKRLGLARHFVPLGTHTPAALVSAVIAH